MNYLTANILLTKITQIYLYQTSFWDVTSNNASPFQDQFKVEKFGTIREKVGGKRWRE